MLFNTKAVGNKIMNTTTALNKSATIVTGSTPAGKRKSTFTDKNDENCALSANKQTTKQVLGAKTPLSSKKQRKGSLLSPKPQAPIAGLSKTLPAIPTYTMAAAAAPTSTTMAPINVETNTTAMEIETTERAVTPVEVVADVPSTTVDSDPTMSVSAAIPNITDAQEGVELTTLPKKALFADADLEQCTSGRSSISSLGESIAPAVYADPAMSVDAVSIVPFCTRLFVMSLFDAVRMSQDEITDPMCPYFSAPYVQPAPVNSAEGAVQEQVQDVLDYLLELDEVDEQTYRRMSSTNFTAKTLKRLSMTMTVPAVVEADTVLPIAVTEGKPPDRQSTCYFCVFFTETSTITGRSKHI